MVQFHETKIGQKFLEGTIPELVRVLTTISKFPSLIPGEKSPLTRMVGALERIAVELKRMNDQWSTDPRIIVHTPHGTTIMDLGDPPLKEERDDDTEREGGVR